MFLHQTRATRRFLSTLTKFDLASTSRALETVILIKLLEQLETSTIAKIIKFHIQQLFMACNWS